MTAGNASRGGGITLAERCFDFLSHCFIPSTVPSRGLVTFFAPPKKVIKERGSPVRRRYLVSSCGDPALLDQPGGLRNSRTVHAIRGRSGWRSLRNPMGKRGAPSARPRPGVVLRKLSGRELLLGMGVLVDRVSHGCSRKRACG